MRKIASAIVIAAMLAGSTAQAANIAAMSGVVSVNQGSGYQTAKKPGPLNPGDMVLVGPGGLAQVSYSCGLNETVTPGAVYTVADDAQKCAQARLANGPKPSYLGHEGVGTGGGGWIWVAVAVATAGVTCLIWWCNSSSSFTS